MKRLVFAFVFIFLTVFCFSQDFDSAYRDFHYNYDFVDQCERSIDQFPIVGDASEVYVEEYVTIIFHKSKTYAIMIEQLTDSIRVTYSVAPGYLSEWLKTRTAEMCLETFYATGISRDYTVICSVN